MLAAQRPDGRIAEAGTGCGVGAAWIVTGLSRHATLVTVEHDAVLAASATELLASQPNVEVIHGDAAEVLSRRGPFDVLFLDARTLKRAPEHYAAELLGLLSPGGTTLLDDLTPGRPIEGDPVRDFWLRHPDLVAVELLTTPTTAAILATRRA